MKSLIATILLILSLFGCETKQPENVVEKAAIKTVTKDALSQKQIDEFFDNPFRYINNFEIKVGNLYMDSINYLFSNSQQFQITTKRDICGGDCCYSIKTVKSENKVFHFFKGDCGEYGFSNDQFYLVNDSLKMIRNYSVSVGEWSTDSTETGWKAEEKIYLFDTTGILFKQRKKLTRNTKDLNLDKEIFESMTIDEIGFHKAKIHELNELLAGESVPND